MPCVVNGVEYRTNDILKQKICSDHKVVLANVHKANDEIFKEVKFINYIRQLKEELKQEKNGLNIQLMKNVLFS